MILRKLRLFCYDIVRPCLGMTRYFI